MGGEVRIIRRLNNPQESFNPYSLWNGRWRKQLPTLIPRPTKVSILIHCGMGGEDYQPPHNRHWAVVSILIHCGMGGEVSFRIGRNHIGRNVSILIHCGMGGEAEVPAAVANAIACFNPYSLWNGRWSIVVIFKLLCFRKSFNPYSLWNGRWSAVLDATIEANEKSFNPYSLWNGRWSVVSRNTHNMTIAVSILIHCGMGGEVEKLRNERLMQFRFQSLFIVEWAVKILFWFRFFRNYPVSILIHCGMGGEEFLRRDPKD